ncbi:hypothetical protein J0H58_34910 [bacterium]|nr:hypothetical protein [bacterium]
MADPDGTSTSDLDRAAEIHAAEAELLNRAREVGRRITERVRKVLDDTRPDQAALKDPTAETPPLG